MCLLCAAFVYWRLDCEAVANPLLLISQSPLCRQRTEEAPLSTHVISLPLWRMHHSTTHRIWSIVLHQYLFICFIWWEESVELTERKSQCQSSQWHGGRALPHCIRACGKSKAPVHQWHKLLYNNSIIYLPPSNASSSRTVHPGHGLRGGADEGSFQNLSTSPSGTFRPSPASSVIFSYVSPPAL